MSLLEAKGLVKHFDGLVALRGVDFHVREGEILGLIGPNGSGKTTLFDAIGGQIRLTTGRVRFAGRDISGLKPHQICHLGIARTFQIVRPFLHLPVWANVAVGEVFGKKGVQPADVRVQAREVLDLVGLAHKEGALARTLSLGQLKLLELARALATCPRLLLLDEVGAGLSPTAGDQLRRLILELRGQGITILGIEHAPRAVAEVSDRMVVLHRGQIIAEGAPEWVINNEAVIEAYLEG